ncbi:MAG: alkene reductase [Candidatus Kapabacteria bacterium]|nr:alkene reductase [Ignavibacteriota bacterium]MCW5885639.1 alkene reductase [Candidatus Kapabacteria bacterium]
MNNLELLKPYKLGNIELKNKTVMAPMTRSRAFTDNIPNEKAPLYYGQRASAGLIITEGTQVSPRGIGYLWTPGIYTNEQKNEWKKVVEAVHNKGGKIFLQLWHVGRISHSDFHNGNQPLAPSAKAAVGKTYTQNGFLEFSTPKEMTLDDIKQTIEEFRTAAESAKECGFDGVDIHGAFGYLIDQFLCTGSNLRTDEYGGSIENRSRFALEVIDAVQSVWESNRVGIKLSPSNIFNDMHDDNPKETFSYLIKKLNDYNLAYIHLMEPQTDVSDKPNYITNVAEFFRPIYNGTLISNAGHTRESGEKYIKEGIADLISYGNLYISNPDLPERFANDYPLAEADKKTFYGGGDEGYIDYPAYK